jgi:hypothetical protein
MDSNHDKVIQSHFSRQERRAIALDSFGLRNGTWHAACSGGLSCALVKIFLKILGFVILGVLVAFLGLCALVGLVYVVYLIYAMTGGDFR